MAIYAYCLLRLPAEEDWPVMQGIDGHPVFPLRCGKYTMLMSRLDSNYKFTPRSIVQHGQIIGHAFETHTVLPMRFGTSFQSEKQVVQLIQENRSELLEAFCRLRGRAEMRLKLLLPPDVQNPGSPKKSLPKSLAAGKRRSNGNGAGKTAEAPMDARSRMLAEQLAVWAREMFRPLEQQVRCRMIPGSELLVDCAHLIENKRVASYQKLRRSAAEQIKGCELRISGPWPPYHFLPTSIRLPAATPPVLRARAAVAAR
ncbi:MAG: GvpL/GvpF family gas vesicle protein [Acidobacteriota bacterium]